MTEKEKLQEEIKQARNRLDEAIKNISELDSYYYLSLKLDELIEKYIDLCENKKVSQGI